MTDRASCGVLRALCAAGVFSLVLPTFAELTADMYQGRDALRVQFDGIDNQGTGSHVSDATTWKSLVGDVILDIYTERANFADADNALTCVDRERGIAGLARTAWSSPGVDLTIEAVFDAAKSGQTMVLWSPYHYDRARHFYLASSGYVSYQSNASYLTTDNGWGVGVRSLAAIFDPATVVEASYVNGEPATMTKRNPGYYRYDTSHTQLGGCWSLDAGSNTPETGIYPFIGKVHAMRFYTRKLTAAEVRYNAHLDEARFNYGGTLHVLGFPDEYGTPIPAYGSSSPAEAMLEFSPGPLETYADGAKAVRVADGIRTCCLGWVKNGDFSVTNAIPDGPVQLADVSSFSWIWERQYHITVAANDECPTVSLNGMSGAFVEKWIADGTPVTVVAVPTDASLVTASWRPTPSGATVSAVDSTLSFVASGPADLVPWTAEKASLRYWRGTSSASAKAAANWVDVTGANALPADGSTVIIDADSNGKPMTWDLNDVTLGNWVQGGPAVTVTFYTGPGGNASGAAKAAYGVLDADGVTRILKVTGDILFTSGTWTHPAQPKFSSGEPGLVNGTGVWRVAVKADGDFEVGADATVDVRDKGFTNSQGPNAYSGSCGGSHGGIGTGESCASYGDPCAPVTVGSCTYSAASYYGGGAIELKAGGAFVLNGQVIASAKDSPNYYGGGGGSAWITVASLSGSGAVLANGGKAPSGSPGGGGRIALYLTGEGQDFSGFTGKVEARQGGNGGADSPGTIYRETAATAGNGELEVTGCGVMSARRSYTGLPARAEPYRFSKVILGKGARLGVMQGATVHIGALEGESKGLASLTLRGGTVILPQDTTISKLNLFALEPGSQLLAEGTEEGTTEQLALTLAGDAQLTCDAPLSLAALTMQSGAVMKHSDNASDGYLSASMDRYVRIDLAVAGDVTIDEGATIDLVGIGAKAYSTSLPGATLNKSGSHGGSADGVADDRCFGSLTQPIEPGMGGQYNGSGSYLDAYGAGAVKIIAGGVFTLNGSILAHGRNFSNVTIGTGAGGSVWLAGSRLVGKGVINVNGGRTKDSTNGGGGGRVAIYLTKDGATLDEFYAAGGVISAIGGGYTAVTGAGTSGGAGTVYVSTVKDGVTTGTLTVDNRAKDTATGVTAISPSVTDARIDNLVVTNGARLVITEDAALQVAGAFDPKGRFTANPASGVGHSAGTVEFVDATREATVQGANEFQAFVCTTPGKTIRFSAGEGDLTTIAETGALRLQGDEPDGDHVFLRSTEDGTWWNLKVVSGAETQVQYVNVKDSDAKSAGGVDISAKDSKGIGENPGWLLSSVIIGETNRWTGAVDGSWGNPGNWDKSRPAEPTDVIVISADAPNMPTLAAPTVLHKLEVEEGATLALAGYDMTVSNELTVAGALVCSGNETVTACTNALFTGGTFTAANSTFVLAGAVTQTFDPAGNAFNRVVVSGAGELAIADGFSAAVFACEPDAAFSIVFAAGSTCEPAEFTVHGTDAERVALSSSVPGTRWNLKVTKLESVYGVTVRDSSAIGLAVNADRPSTDLGNNANWIFGGATEKWVGADGGKFSDTNNWSNLAVPDATTRLVLDADASITLDVPATVREIYGPGGTTTFRPGTNVLTVASSVVLEDGTTVSLNVPTVVSNNVMMRTGSVLTHERMTVASAAITNRIDLTVGGDVTVMSGARIDAIGKGWTSGLSKVLGFSEMGSSHGGVGVGGIDCYGSVFEPDLPGAGSAGIDTKGYGGGIIRLSAGGVLSVDGTISADASTYVCYGAAGGSVWLTVGRLVGAANGRISATGGRMTDMNAGRYGGGGRVAVYTADGDFSGFAGTIGAYGSCRYNSSTGIETIDGAAGTVYLASQVAPKAGRVVIDGGRAGISGQYAQLPAAGFGGDDPKDFRDVTIEVRNGGGVSFTENLKIAELEYTKTKVSVKLNDHEVFIESMRHRNADRRPNRGWVAREIENRGPNGLGRYLWNQGLLLLVK